MCNKWWLIINRPKWKDRWHIEMVWGTADRIGIEWCIFFLSFSTLATAEWQLAILISRVHILTHTHTHSASMIENMQLFLDNIMVGQVMKWLRLHTHLHWILQFVDMLHVIEIHITFCLFFVRFLRPFINLSIYLFLIVSAQVAPAFIEHKHLICFCNYKWHMHTHIKQWINSPSDCDEHACHTYFYTSLFITILHTFLFFPPCTEQFLSLHFNKKIGFSRYNDCNPWQNMQFWLVCWFVCLFGVSPFQ